MPKITSLIGIPRYGVKIALFELVMPPGESPSPLFMHSTKQGYKQHKQISAVESAASTKTIIRLCAEYEGFNILLGLPGYLQGDSTDVFTVALQILLWGPTFVGI